MANECNIYNTNGFRHENILGFIAADNIDRGTYTELWIITEFHSNGSLFDFLNLNTISINELLKMSISIVNGLDHLHTPIESCTGKPALAHCDLKSKNILVKSSYECCIADFGLAVRFNSENNKLDVGTNQIREGSQRYMAPECLNGSLNVGSIDELKSCDIYSFSLIIWELIRCFAETDVEKEAYAPPYFEYVNVEPTLEQMKSIVCDKNIRPTITNCKLNDKRLEVFISVINECWQYSPTCRLQSLRIKKYLNQIN